MKTFPILALLTGICLAADAAHAQNESETPNLRRVLPQEHEYQRVLRTYMATLTGKDFDHGVASEMSGPPSKPDLEDQYRNHFYTQMNQPMIGSKRGVPAINAPPERFLLSAIETGDGVKISPVWPEALISFVEWDYAGNPYHDNKALKMRAFVTAAVDLMMLDDYHEQNPTAGRPDWHAYQLIYVGAAYPGVKDLLPAEVRAAYESGLRRMGRRVLDWGIRGEAPDLDLIAPVALTYVGRALNDPEFDQEVEARARTIFTDPRYFHPAGYWVDRGGIDTGFAGMANFFATGAALAADWPFAKEAVDRIYRLRAHLILPEPDGSLTGPSHFNSRIGSPPNGDQWAWGSAREYAASMITDEAAHAVATPTAEELQAAAARRSNDFAFHIKENPRVRFDPNKHAQSAPPAAKGARRAAQKPATFHFLLNEEIENQPWSFRMWKTYNFPASVNFGYEFYKPGALAHRQELEKKKSPMLRSPFERPETFVRNFDDAFIVAKQPTYAAIVHTGPVGSQRAGGGYVEFQGPLGFGGGQLSAFWTPQAGSVLLGRRRGMNFNETFDRIDEWRTWPIHAVTGQTPAGTVFTSARIVQPAVKSEIKPSGGKVEVSGIIPAEQLNQDSPALAGELAYARTFEISPAGVGIETRLTAAGKDTAVELYETLPIYHGDAKQQASASPPAITFQVGGQWEPATADLKKNVTAVRVERFEGAIEIRFDSPQAVRLSPEPWADTYLSRAVCRTLLIDLLGGDGKPAVLSGERVVRYRVAPIR